MGSSPARLVIALSVAAALAIFVVYTALAGNGVAQLRPSTLAGHTGNVALVGAVVGKPNILDAHTKAGMRFALKDVRSSNPARVPVVYHGAVPDLFKSGSDVVVNGTMRNGVFVATPGSLITKCPDHYGSSKSSNT
ncbi:MAG TPA: cytochrome c maturation protein CcmE [Gaiellaceae bacterium]|nr:cytochrome c maturation protein CcmE [Gaiellaceae bacterium]